MHSSFCAINLLVVSGQPTGPRHFPDVCQDCEHTNKETGLVCHSCGGTRRNTNDCTREFKLVKREERKELTISEPLPNFRSRAQQIQQANPKRDNHLYGDVYAAGAIHGPWSPAPNCRITNYPPERKLAVSFILVSIHSSIHPSIHPCIHSCIHASMHPSIQPPIHRFTYPSMRSSVR